MKKYPASLLAVLAASMLLAGCGGDSKAGAPPPSTKASPPTATTASPTTTSDAPTKAPGPKTDSSTPAAARAHTPAGAEAFVRYFFERLNLAWTAPRAGILSPLCQASSKACAAFEKSATQLTTQGHRYDGNPVTVKFIGALDSPGANKLHVLANVVAEPRSEIDAAGKKYVTDKREDLRFDFELLYTGQAWSATSINLMK